MKYKIGDKVKLKEGDHQYSSIVQTAINETLSNHIGVIDEVEKCETGRDDFIYMIKNFEFGIFEKEIEYIIVDIPISSRFEILDL